MLLDGQLRRLEIDLLDDPGLLAVETQLPTTTGTSVQGVNQEEIDLLGSEQGAFVQGMARLATRLAFAPSRSQRRRWLDDVRRGRFRGGRGVLARSSELLLQTGHRSLQLLELLLQPLASRTSVRCCFCHPHVLFSTCLTDESWA